MKRIAGYESDDGQMRGTKAEVERYEAEQRLKAWLNEHLEAYDVSPESVLILLAAEPAEASALLAPLVPAGKRRSLPRKPRADAGKPRSRKAPADGPPAGGDGVQPTGSAS